MPDGGLGAEPRSGVSPQGPRDGIHFRRALPQGPLSLLRKLPPAVRLLVAGTFVNRIGTLIVPYLSLVLVREFHLDAWQAGALMTAYGAGAICAILGGGVLTDRLGRRPTLMLSLFGGGGLAVAMGAAPSVQAFVPLLLLFGFVSDLYRPAATAMISDLLPSSQRALGFAALRSAVNLGFAIGVALGGVLADVTWRLLFAGDGLTSLLFGLIVWRVVKETRPPSADPARAAAAAGSPWRDRVFVEVLVASFLSCLVLFSFATVLPLTVTAVYPARVYGLLMAVNGVLIALFEMSVVQLLGGVRRLRAAALGFLLMGLGFGAVGFFQHWTALLVCVVMWTVGEILSGPQAGAFVADWSPPEARGRYMAAFQATFSLAVALNPVLFLPLHARLGDARFWPLVGLISVPAALLILHLDRDADQPRRLRGLTTAAPAVSA
jgi:MFS family permease